MKKITKVVLVSAAITVSVVSLAAFAGADRGFCKGEGFAGHIEQRITRELQLNESQQANLQGLIETVAAKRDEFRQDKSEQRTEILNLLDAETLDQSRIAAMISNKVSSVETAAPEVVTALAQFTDSLDAEQRAELKENLEKRMSHRRWR